MTAHARTLPGTQPTSSVTSISTRTTATQTWGGTRATRTQGRSSSNYASRLSQTRQPPHHSLCPTPSPLSLPPSVPRSLPPVHLPALFALSHLHLPTDSFSLAPSQAHSFSLVPSHLFAGFPSTLYVTGIEIYEIHKPGAIVRISSTQHYSDDNTVACCGPDMPAQACDYSTCSSNTSWTPLWSGSVDLEANTGGKPTILRPNVCPFRYLTDTIRIDMVPTERFRIHSSLLQGQPIRVGPLSLTMDFR